MTAFFVEKFKRENQCWNCKADKLSGYSMCAKHLEKAKLDFRAWAKRRRRQRLCCYCDRRSFKGWLRCKTHTLVNRVKCLRWNRLHPEHGREAWEKRKKLLALGICICRAHRTIPAGFRRCEECRARGARNGKASLARRHAAGLCACGRVQAPDGVQCRRCKKVNSAKGRAYYQRMIAERGPKRSPQRGGTPPDPIKMDDSDFMTFFAKSVPAPQPRSTG